MLDHLLGLDRQRASIAAKSCVAILIGYALALSLEWKASSVATTIVILQTSALGSTLHKAFLRVLGTLGGAMIGVLLVAICAHDRELFFLAMASVTGVCVWAMQGSSYQYAWMLTVVTTAVVGWPAATDPLNTFPTAVDRVTVVVVGVVLASLAHGVFWPITAAAQFERSMRNLVTGCRDLLSSVRAAVDQGAVDRDAICKSNSDLLNLARSLDGILSTARQDSKRVRRFFDRYQQLSAELMELVLATGALCDSAMQSLRDRSATVPQGYNEHFDRAFDTASASLEATIDQFSLPRDGSAVPLDSQPKLSEQDNQSESNPVQTVLVGRIDHLQRIAADVRRLLSGLEDPQASVPVATPVLPGPPAFAPRLKKATIAAAQVLVSTWFFVSINWPLGLQAGMLLVMVVAFLNAQLPVALPTRAFVKATLIALPVSMVFYFLVMPRTDGFAELAPWLALMFFPFLYVVTSHNPLTSMVAILAVLLANSLVSISTTPPNYNFASFLTMYLGLAGGFGVSLLLAYLLETRNPRLGCHKLLAVILEKSADYVGKWADPSLAATERTALAKSYRDDVLRNLTQLHKLSAVACDGQDLRTNRMQIQSASRAIDVLVMKMIWSGVASSPPHSGIPDGAENDSIRRASDRCVESLRETVKGLQGFQIAAFASDGNVPDDIAGHTGPVRSDVLEAALLTYYGALEDAIDDCKIALAAVDWKRWCGDHF